MCRYFFFNYNPYRSNQIKTAYAYIKEPSSIKQLIKYNNI